MSSELHWGEGKLEVHLRFMGGWGMDNLTSACGWMATGMRWRTARQSTFVIHTGRGMLDNLNAVLGGTVDIAITTPGVNATMALQGLGPYTEPHIELRALAALPHRDRLLLGINVEASDRYGMRSLPELVAKRPPLRIATGINDGINMIGYAVEKVINAHGMAWEDLEQWGGQWLTSETPFPALKRFADGEADALFFEAITLWPGIPEQRAYRLLPIHRLMLEGLHHQYGFERADVEPGELPGVTQTVPCVDFSQWLIVTREDLPEEVAYLITSVIVEERHAFESRYTHQPLNVSALHYPIKPEELCRTAPTPLHAGAERYYREHGYLG
ncbi:MAG: hypothetical protein H0W02_09515 [Ktedonobacteraceae bacterium]|nr:hypothetical protein [Ktedonobacteraceae bacterium]